MHTFRDCVNYRKQPKRWYTVGVCLRSSPMWQCMRLQDNTHVLTLTCALIKHRHLRVQVWVIMNEVDCYGCLGLGAMVITWCWQLGERKVRELSSGSLVSLPLWPAGRLLSLSCWYLMWAHGPRLMTVLLSNTDHAFYSYAWHER